LTDGWQLQFVFTLYEDTAAKFDADCWICGRETMQEVSHGGDYPKGHAKGEVPRTDHFLIAMRASTRFPSIRKGVLDGRGIRRSNRTSSKSTEGVANNYLAHLQSIGVSYIFGGKSEIDLKKVVQTLATEPGIKKLIVEGGSRVSGAFVNVGLADEVIRLP
jgi:riboflavin biosynthesis pyrimidine reductase